jgi:hypothetical protein
MSSCCDSLSHQSRQRGFNDFQSDFKVISSVRHCSLCHDSDFGRMRALTGSHGNFDQKIDAAGRRMSRWRAWSRIRQSMAALGKTLDPYST